MDEDQKKVMVTLRLPPKLRQRLKQCAQEEGVSQAHIVAEALADWMESVTGEKVAADE